LEMLDLSSVPISFFGCFHLDRNHILKKGNEPRSLPLIRKIKVHSIPKSLNIQTAPMRPMLQNQLLQIQKRPLMPHPLPHLHQTPPNPLPKLRLTIRTLLIPNNKHHHKTLLQNRPQLHLLLHRQPNLQPHRMRLRPYPPSINQPHLLPILPPLRLIQPGDILQTQTHQFAGFEFAAHPFAGVEVPALAAAALVEGGFGGYSAGYVGFGGEAGGAGVGWVGGDGDSAHAAEDVYHFLGGGGGGGYGGGGEGCWFFHFVCLVLLLGVGCILFDGRI